MPWEICFGHATDGIRQECYISVNSKRDVTKTGMGNGKWEMGDGKLKMGN